ncbi:MAG: Crp/Fnr family transcriptional regulator [Saprospiraceae bacterium]|nr:Crp/Fnr family transcriptional regulator [Saprospiraceae bacterium]
MSTDLLLQNIRKHISLTGVEGDKIISKLKKITLKKKQFLLHEGQIAHEVAFVISGCLRSFSVDENGFEHILQFAPAEWWITDMYSFISEKEAHLSIDALMDTEIMTLSRKNQLQLFDEIPGLERYFRILTENSLVASRSRLIDNLSLTAKQRYQKFCTTYPSLINTLPQKLIAAYIGVTPEFLSKLRKL